MEGDDRGPVAAHRQAAPALYGRHRAHLRADGCALTEPCGPRQRIDSSPAADQDVSSCACRGQVFANDDGLEDREDLVAGHADASCMRADRFRIPCLVDANRADAASDSLTTWLPRAVSLSAMPLIKGGHSFSQ